MAPITSARHSLNMTTKPPQAASLNASMLASGPQPGLDFEDFIGF